MGVRKQFKKLKRQSRKRKRRKRRIYKSTVAKNGRSFDVPRLTAWSKAVRSRDNFICKSCGSKTTLHAHHMVSKYYVPKYAYNLNNGITLCRKCHTGSSGVHGKDKPATEIISQLRNIYHARDISRAELILMRLGSPLLDRRAKVILRKKSKK